MTSSIGTNVWASVPMYARFTEAQAIRRADNVDRATTVAEEQNEWFRKAAPFHRHAQSKAAARRREAEGAQYERERAKAQSRQERICGTHVSPYDLQFTPRSYGGGEPRTYGSGELLQVL